MNYWQAILQAYELRSALFVLVLVALVSSLCSAQNQNEPLVVVQNGKYGFIDHSGNVVIRPRFIWANDFWHGRAAVYVCGRYASINSRGELFPRRVAVEGQLVPKKQGDKYGFVDSTGSFQIKPAFDDVLPFSEGLAAVNVGGQWGFVDRSGRQVIEPKFEDAYYFKEGLAFAHLQSDPVLIDVSGRVVASDLESYDIISDGRVPASTDGRAGYLDLQGRVAVPFIYEFAMHFSDGLAAVEKGGKWGYLDRNGMIAIPFRFDSAGSFGSGLAPVKTDTTTGFIDKSGKFSFYLPFDYAPGFFTGSEESDEFVADYDVSRFWTEDHRFGYVNTSGKVIWGPSYEGPDHAPLMGWTKEDDSKSCEDISDSEKAKVTSFP